MKIGIFIQGQLRRSDGELNLMLDVLSDAFPDAEFCYATWNTEYEKRKEFCDSLTGNLELFEEFDIGYEPYLDNPDAVKDYQYYKKYNDPNPPRHRHQTKQILLHNELIKKYGHRYDVIVRTRWDSTASPFIDFMPYVKEAYDTPAMVTLMGRPTLNNKMCGIYDRCNSNFPYHLYYFGDGHIKYVNVAETHMVSDSGLIIHKTDDWNCDLVDELHNTKKLLAAEFGWWQVLVDGTSHHNWVNYTGGCMLTRCIQKDERALIKKAMGYEGNESLEQKLW